MVIVIEELQCSLRKGGKSDSYLAKARGMLYQIMNKAEANELINHTPCSLPVFLSGFNRVIANWNS